MPHFIWDGEVPFLNITMGLLADLSFTGWKKPSHQNLRGNWLGIGRCWSSQLELRDISPIWAEIVQITEIRPLVSGAHTWFRDCSERLLTHEGQTHLAEAVGLTEYEAAHLGSVSVYLWCWETHIAYPRGLLLVSLCDIRWAYALLTLKCSGSQFKLSKVRKCPNSCNSPSPLSCLGSCCLLLPTHQPKH